jgi:hypothetical protein
MGTNSPHSVLATCVLVSLVLLVTMLAAVNLAQAQGCPTLENSLNRLVANRSALTAQLNTPNTPAAQRTILKKEFGQLQSQVVVALQKVRNCMVAALPKVNAPVHPLATPKCASLQTSLNNAEAYQKEVSAELKKVGITPSQRSQLQEALRQTGGTVNTLKQQLAACQHPTTPPPLSGALAPQRILEIEVKNPVFTETGHKYDWAAEIANGNTNPESWGTFPETIGREWVQILSPQEDYDYSTVGATGWAINPRTVDTDFPFDHPFLEQNPFRSDWETSLALDMNQNGTGPYTSLLSHGDLATPDHPDEVADQSHAYSLGLPTALGLLGIETDGFTVSDAFKNGISDGSRLAVYGRWIVDAGHASYRAEIHPPLLMAEASVVNPSETHVIFTSRPYLMSNVYTTDQSKIYDDNSGDDGTFFGHMEKELAKVLGVPGFCPVPNIPCSTLVEAHVKVKSHPFEGVQLMHLKVRPPSTPLHINLALERLVVSYRFTVRAGCAVQVISSAADTVDVFVSMNSVGYHPPPLPARTTHNYSVDELNNLDEGVGSTIIEIEAAADTVAALSGFAIKGPAVAAILGQGVQGDNYASVSGKVDVLSRTGAVENASVSNIPAGAGITVDDSDNQPFPVTGWLEVKWETSSVSQPTH